MFKVGDTVRRVGGGGGTEPFVIGRLGHRRKPCAWPKGGSDYDFHFLENLELVRPATPAERKQEQLDLIAEKERIIGECNEAIKAARKLIAEIDNRPIDVGDHVIPKGLKPSPVNAYYLVVGKHIYRCGTTLVTQCMLAPNDPANARDIPISSRIDSWEHDPRV